VFTTAEEPEQPLDVRGRDRPAELLMIVGASCIVLGGLVAAFTGPLELTDGSWLAAYLVLVCGVAQYAIGRVPPRLGARAVSAGPTWAGVTCWNLGNLAVIGGTLSATPVLVDAGATLLALGLTVAWRAVRHVGPTMLRDRAGQAATWAYRVMLLGLLAGTVIGMFLAHRRHPT
jgi:hypothetical protein